MGAAAQIITTEQDNLQRFFALHFQTDGEHIGCVHLAGVRSDGVFQRMIYGSPEQLIGKIEQLDPAHCCRPFYITANTFSAGSRSEGSLFSFHNIVIDIDCHGESSGETAGQRDHKIDALRFFLVEDLLHDPEFYAPNTITRTGRGLQLWWSVEQMAAGTAHARKINGRHLQIVREHLERKLDQLIEAHKGVLDGLSVDRGASGNLSGLFRLPGSYNQKVRRFGSFEIIHDEQLNAYEAAKKIRTAAGTARKSEKPAQTIRIPQSDATAYATARSRQRSLEKLVQLRGSAAGEGLRDEFAFCSYANWSQIYADHEAIMEHVENLNGLFADPLSEKQLERYLRTAKKKRYKLSTAGMIDRLQITDEEQEAIGLHPAGGNNRYKRQQEQEARAEAKRARDEKILELWEAGERQEDIAAAAGCSMRTIQRVIAAADAGRWKPLHEKILEKTADGEDQKTIAQELACCRQTVRNHTQAEKNLTSSKNASNGLKNDKGEQIHTEVQKAAVTGTEASDSTLKNASETSAPAAVLSFDEYRLRSMLKTRQNLPGYIRGGSFLVLLGDETEIPEEDQEVVPAAGLDGSLGSVPPGAGDLVGSLAGVCPGGSPLAALREYLETVRARPGPG